jgi:hypothetical protein
MQNIKNQGAEEIWNHVTGGKYVRESGSLRGFCAQKTFQSKGSNIYKILIQATFMLQEVGSCM